MAVVDASVTKASGVCQESRVSKAFLTGLEGGKELLGPGDGCSTLHFGARKEAV